MPNDIDAVEKIKDEIISEILKNVAAPEDKGFFVKIEKTDSSAIAGSY